MFARNPVTELFDKLKNVNKLFIIVTN